MRKHEADVVPGAVNRIQRCLLKIAPAMSSLEDEGPYAAHPICTPYNLLPKLIFVQLLLLLALL